jgi:hypothetical protein
MLTNFLNFVLVAGSLQAARGLCSRESSESVFVTVLPSAVRDGPPHRRLRFSYQRLGVGAVGLAAGRLVRLPVPAQGRGRGLRPREQLQQRTRELASLQVGLINTVSRRCRCATR